jgi:hypothetical protein
MWPSILISLFMAEGKDLVSREGRARRWKEPENEMARKASHLESATLNYYV